MKNFKSKERELFDKMFEGIELYIYNKYIKNMIIEENGEKKISKNDLDKLILTSQEKNFIMYIINKHKIKIVNENITKIDRSQYVKDNNYGDIITHGMQQIDEQVMSNITYSPSGERTYEDYSKLDEYLETRFIPTYVTLKRRKKENRNFEYFLSISLHHIMALKLSEVEVEHVINYLKEKKINVSGKGSTLDGEFDSYYYVTTYKESALPLNISSDDTMKKIALYKQSNDQKLRQEIITENMRLVPYVAHRYSIISGIDQHELESYGYEGLILALENIDISYGYKFSSYAIACIKGYILKGISNILLNKRDNFYYDYVNAKNFVEKQNGLTISEDPSLIDDIIDLLVANQKIKNSEESKEFARKKIVLLTKGNISLDDEEVVEELLLNDQMIDSKNYDEEAINLVIREDVEKVLDTLTPREADIIKLRFGFYDNKPKTLYEIAEIYGISYTRIRQILEKAIKKLKHSSEMRNIRFYYEDFNAEKNKK